MWRGGCRSEISVSAPFVWRCLSSSTMTPFPHPAHRTGLADLPHPALGQDLTPSPTARRVQAQLGVRARSARRGARVDRSIPLILGRPAASEQMLVSFTRHPFGSREMAIEGSAGALDIVI